MLATPWKRTRAYSAFTRNFISNRNHYCWNSFWRVIKVESALDNCNPRRLCVRLSKRWELPLRHVHRWGTHFMFRHFFEDVKQVIRLDPTYMLYRYSWRVYVYIVLQTSCSVMKCNAFSTACNVDMVWVAVVRKLEITAEIACSTGGVFFYSV